MLGSVGCAETGLDGFYEIVWIAEESFILKDNGVTLGEEVGTDTILELFWLLNVFDGLFTNGLLGWKELIY